MEKRMFSIEEAMAYTGLGKNRLYDFAREAGALKKYGKRTLIDRVLIDRSIDRMGAEK